VPFVLTVDQRDSRNAEDEVDALVGRLVGTATRLPFHRTAVHHPAGRPAALPCGGLGGRGGPPTNPGAAAGARRSGHTVTVATAVLRLVPGLARGGIWWPGPVH